jgi:BirA family transcriptional regulator, biotin operon repressor / biotin---[acetyl-CoA-carboxylase] ligase
VHQFHQPPYFALYNTAMSASHPSFFEPLPTSAIDPLDAGVLRGLLAQARLECELEVVQQIDSTNSELLRRARKQQLEADRFLLAAEFQTGGRGRLGRNWQADAGSAVTASYARRLHCSLATLSGLSLACGLAVRTALARHGVPADLKWPNDVLVRGRKLAGILVEVHAVDTTTTIVIIGVGVNVSTAPSAADGLDATSLAAISMLEASGESAIDRCALLADLAIELDGHLDGFERAGFAAFVEPWNAAHAWRGQAVELLEGGKVQSSGIAGDVDRQGRLTVNTPAGPTLVLSGEVSLRRLR